MCASRSVGRGYSESAADIQPKESLASKSGKFIVSSLLIDEKRIDSITVRLCFSIVNTYRYDIDAIDYVDQQAKLHDQGYDRLRSVGASGLFNDWGTTPYDEAAATAWSTFYSNNKEGSVDPFNGQAVTSRERSAAWRGKNLFNAVVGMKKNAISAF